MNFIKLNLPKNIDISEISIEELLAKNLQESPEYDFLVSYGCLTTTGGIPRLSVDLIGNDISVEDALTWVRHQQDSDISYHIWFGPKGGPKEYFPRMGNIEAMKTGVRRDQ